MLFILLACSAPKPLSDDEDILVNPDVGFGTADTDVGTGFDSGSAVDSSGDSVPREHAQVRLEGWLTAGELVDATEVVGGALQVRRTTTGLSCLHTGLVMPCGDASAAALIVDGGEITVPYVSDSGLDSGEGNLKCAWTMAYSLEGLGTDGGTVRVTFASTGEELVRATFASVTTGAGR